MSSETFFQLANFSVIPFWLLLAIVPRWKGTQFLVHSVAMPMLLGGVYIGLFASGAFFGPNVPEGGGFGSLAEVKVLFTSDEAVLAGWVHYLVFDLFVGAWISRDSIRRAVPHLAVIPCLVLTLFLGPTGLVLYLIVRLLLRKGGWSLDRT